MREAYTQLELDADSRKITNFQTDEGVYRHKRLVYEINNSFEIFQKTMEQSYGKIDRVKFISDDIIIYASDKQGFLRKLELLFIKPRALDLKLNLKKCIFAQEEIKFFGFKTKMVLILIQTNKRQSRMQDHRQP